MAVYTVLLSRGIEAGPIVFYIGASLSAIGGIGFILLSNSIVKHR